MTDQDKQVTPEDVEEAFAGVDAQATDSVAEEGQVTESGSLSDEGEKAIEPQSSDAESDAEGADDAAEPAGSQPVERADEALEEDSSQPSAEAEDPDKGCPDDQAVNEVADSNPEDANDLPGDEANDPDSGDAADLMADGAVESDSEGADGGGIDSSEVLPLQSADQETDEPGEGARPVEESDQMKENEGIPAVDALEVEEREAKQLSDTADLQLPDAADLRAELAKERQRSTFFRVLRSTVFSLVVVAAVAVIVVTLVLPILQISGSSMTDTLYDQDIVVAVRGSDCQTGDVIAFYYNNKILVKRVIANSGQWVDIDDSGNVYVDGVLLVEPYVTEKALGDCNIKLPYQVPENRIFVMGDHRSVSVDSRSTTVGCVADEQIVGKLVFCAWPFERFGIVC